jgi:hypothetical protein
MSSDHVQNLQRFLLREMNIESNKINEKILSQIVINNSESQKRIIRNFIIKSIIFTLDSIILDLIIFDLIIIVISSIFIIFFINYNHFYNMFNTKSHLVRITHSVRIRHSSKSLHEYSKSRFTARRSKSSIQLWITTRRSFNQLWITIQRSIRSRIESSSQSSIRSLRVRIHEVRRWKPSSREWNSTCISIKSNFS